MAPIRNVTLLFSLTALIDEALQLFMRNLVQCIVIKLMFTSRTDKKDLLFYITYYIKQKSITAAHDRD
jgi:hypothetical protein